MQGRELDPVIEQMPKKWPRRTVDGTELPLVVPDVRTAAVDAKGNLWVAFLTPFTYVYDADRREDSHGAVPRNGNARSRQPVVHADGAPSWRPPAASSFREPV